MTTKPLKKVLDHVCRLATAGACSALSDRQLLERFAAGHDEASFAELVERHGPMVLGVCRRVLGNVHDAEDACQAAFLVLARKAASIRHGQALGSWLHTVARHTACRLKEEMDRKRARERPCIDTPQLAATDEPSWREVLALLDEELQALPKKYRAALVLCYLEDKTRDEAARDLGLSLDTVRGRLERGRERLRTRLLRRGLTFPAALLLAALADGSLHAAMPVALVSHTVRAAGRLAAGSAASLPVVSATVAALTEGVMTSMRLHNLKIGAVSLAAATLLCLSAAALFWSASAAGQPDPPAQKASGQANQAKGAEGPGAGAKSKDQADISAEDEQRFRATLKITDQALLDFFRQLTLSEAEAARVHQLIGQLDAPAFKERDKASTALLAEGHRALSLLLRKKADGKTTLEHSRRLEEIYLKVAGKTDWAATTASAARLLKNRRPEAGVQVLLDFLPFVLADAEEDVLDALAHLAVTDSKLHPQVVAALKSSVPARRAAAAMLVGCHGTPEQRAAAEQLLKDADDGVRFRAAQGLLAAQERRAVPALIDMLATAELPWARRAEGLLQELADKTAPRAVLGKLGSGRELCQAAWKTWWQEHQDKLQWPPVGLKLVNQEALVRKAALDFIAAMLGGDRALLEGSTDLPFFIGSREFITTHQQLHARFASYSRKDGLEDVFGSAQPKFRVLRILSMPEEVSATPDDAERAILAKLPSWRDTLSVHVVKDEDDPTRMEYLAWIVHVSNGRARIIGIVQGKKE
jgi:RNA polymerase sigma factor (sigma-70 family)